MDPVKLVRVLNMYLNEMSEVIIALGGTIDKFEGDAIMAFFGAPIPFLDHAVRIGKLTEIQKALAQAGPQAVDVPGNKSHSVSPLNSFVFPHCSPFL